MTTTQLTQLKNAGFTLEQIITIGEIFDGKMEPSPRKAKPDITEEMRKAYEKGRKEAEDRQRQKDMGPLIREIPGNKAFCGGTSFQKRCDDFIKSQQNSMFIRAMEIPRWISKTVSSELSASTP